MTPVCHYFTYPKFYTSKGSTLIVNKPFSILNNNPLWPTVATKIASVQSTRAGHTKHLKVSSGIKASLGLPIEPAKGNSRFASVGEPSLPIEATLGLPIMIKKQLIYY